MYTARRAAHMRDVRVVLYAFLLLAAVGVVFVARRWCACRATRCAGRRCRAAALWLVIGVVVLGIFAAARLRHGVHALPRGLLPGRQLGVPGRLEPDPALPGAVLGAQRRGAGRARRRVAARSLWARPGAAPQRWRHERPVDAERPLLPLEAARAQMLDGSACRCRPRRSRWMTRWRRVLAEAAGQPARRCRHGTTARWTALPCARRRRTSSEASHAARDRRGRRRPPARRRLSSRARPCAS